MTDLMKYIIAALITICTTTSTLSANWPEFRGANGQGISADANLPLTWSLTNNVTWKVKIKGQGWSSPVVYNGKVYLTAATVDRSDNPRTLRVICIDAKSGDIDWDKKVLSPRGKGVKPMPHPPLTATP